MAQFKLKRMSCQVGLRRCGGCQILPTAQFLLNAFNGFLKHLGLCERTRTVGLRSPWVSFSTHFAFLSGSNILGSIPGSPQSLSQNLQLLVRSLAYSRRSRCVHDFQLKALLLTVFAHSWDSPTGDSHHRIQWLGIVTEGLNSKSVPRRECPLWIISRHSTLQSRSGMSALSPETDSIGVRVE